MKSLFVFYSLTGNTSLVASKIAALLDADIERVLEQAPYSGTWGYFKAAFHSLTGRQVPIQPPKTTPHAYDLIVLAAPIWTGRVAPPLQSYLRQFRGDFKSIACCITRGGSSPEKGFMQMESLSGTPPVAMLALTAKEIAEGQYDRPVRDFVKKLENAMSSRHQDVA